MKAGDDVTFTWSTPIAVDGLPIGVHSTETATNSTHHGIGFQVTAAVSGVLLYHKDEQDLFIVDV